MKPLSSTPQWQNRWGVTGDSGTEYIVAQKADGSFGCSCPGWKFHTPQHDCKHILRVRAEAMGKVRPGKSDLVIRCLHLARVTTAQITGGSIYAPPAPSPAVVSPAPCPRMRGPFASLTVAGACYF